MTRDETTDKPVDPENPFLAQWLATTRSYLFAPGEPSSTGGRATEAPILSAGESHGAQARGLARVRGRLLRLTMRRPADDPDPVHELERIFHALVAFVVRNPDVPPRMLRWSAHGGHRRIRTRVQMVIDQFVSRISFIVRRAQMQARIRRDVEPQVAALLFVGIAQSLVLRLFAGLLSREHLHDEADRLLHGYLTGMRGA